MYLIDTFIIIHVPVDVSKSVNMLIQRTVYQVH